MVRGTVRDSATGKPVSGARIWPYLKDWGVVSDEQGKYEIQWGPGLETFIVRLCDDRNLATLRVDFLSDSVLHRDISIAASTGSACTKRDRPPWAVDARDTTLFTGHYTYSWEGGGWLEACDGATYTPDWGSALARALQWRRQVEGQVSFLRFRGRVAPDRLGDNLAPGVIRMTYPGPIYLVNKVEEVRDSRPDDCK